MVAPIEEIHEFDQGLTFSVTVKDRDGPVDLSEATVIEFHFQKPDGSMLVVDALRVNDGSDGQVAYVTADTDFDQAGTWKHQVYLEIGPNEKWSNINKFKVFPNLPLEI